MNEIDYLMSIVGGRHASTTDQALAAARAVRQHRPALQQQQWTTPVQVPMMGSSRQQQAAAASASPVPYGFASPLPSSQYATSAALANQVRTRRSFVRWLFVGCR